MPVRPGAPPPRDHARRPSHAPAALLHRRPAAQRPLRRRGRSTPSPLRSPARPRACCAAPSAPTTCRPRAARWPVRPALRAVGGTGRGARAGRLRAGDQQRPARRRHGHAGDVARARRGGRRVQRLRAHRRPADRPAAAAPGAVGGRGVYLVNQLCDLVQLRSSEAGTTVRVITWR